MIAWEISWRPRERIIRRGFLFPHGTGSRTRTTFLGVGVLAQIPGNVISQTGERVNTVYLEGRVKEQIFPHIVKQFGLLQLPIYTISNTMTWLKQNEKNIFAEHDGFEMGKSPSFITCFTPKQWPAFLKFSRWQWNFWVLWLQVIFMASVTKDRFEYWAWPQKV